MKEDLKLDVKNLDFGFKPWGFSSVLTVLIDRFFKNTQGFIYRSDKPAVNVACNSNPLMSSSEIFNFNLINTRALQEVQHVQAFMVTVLTLAPPRRKNTKV